MLESAITPKYWGGRGQHLHIGEWACTRCSFLCLQTADHLLSLFFWELLLDFLLRTFSISVCIVCIPMGQWAMFWYFHFQHHTSMWQSLLITTYPRSSQIKLSTDGFNEPSSLDGSNKSKALLESSDYLSFLIFVPFLNCCPLSPIPLF